MAPGAHRGAGRARGARAARRDIRWRRPARPRLAVGMRIEQADLADTRKARECHEVYLAAQRVDEPGGPSFTDRAFGRLAGRRLGRRSAGTVAGHRAEGSVAGWYRLELPGRANWTTPTWT